MTDLGLLLLLTGCGKSQTRHTIGVSQCSEDDWRNQMNREMVREALLYDNVEVEIRTARDNNRNQIDDIKYFIDKKVSLLVIAPNEAEAITPIAEEAVKKGIPIVVVDRKLASTCYTAYIGADNYAIGRAVGEYIGNRLRGKGNVVELTGLPRSTPAIERHKGFTDALDSLPGIRLLASRNAEWLQSPGEQQMDSLLRMFPHIDMVFAHNDRIAVGAYLAARKQGREGETGIVGIDALPDTGAGVDQVLEGVLDATFIYPTGGDKVIQTAMAILEKRPYKKEMLLPTSIVNRNNARMMKLQNRLIDEQEQRVEDMKGRIDVYLSRYSAQQIALYSMLAALTMTVALCILLIRAYRTKDRFNRELERRNDEITRQKEQLEQQRDQLVALSRQLEEATQAKLVFFTNVSHDFRTPLTLIAGPIEQLLSDPSLSDRQSRLLGIARKNCAILLRLVNQILDFRTYENGKMELTYTRFNLRTEMQEWSNSFGNATRAKHIRLSFMAEGADETFEVQMDLEKMERIYFNLLSNALKFTPENGRIDVLLSTAEREGKPCIRLRVADSGIGIPADKLPHIFDRFYKTDIHQSGSGIGLALVKAFVELQGGSISVESEEQKYTAFTVEIPVTPAPNDGKTLREESLEEAKSHLPVPAMEAEYLPVAPEAAPQAEPGKEVILVIDDNPDICRYIAALLGERYTVITAGGGREGVRMAMKYVPDLILCDVMMPDTDGYACCRQLKSELQTCHIPLILLTACSQDEQRISGFESGADSYIAKPFNAKVLEARIRNLLDNRRRLKQFFGEPAALSKEPVSNIDQEFVARFRRLIEERLADSELSVEELGTQMGMSRVQLYRKIKALTNYAPNELLRIARLKRAASLLSSTEKTIAEVTYEVGFTSPSYFTKCYKEYFGENPTALTKRKK